MKKAILVAMILLLTACGQRETDEIQATDLPSEQSPLSAAYDWQNGDWNADLKEDPPHTLYLGRYIDGLQTGVDGNSYELLDTFYSIWGEHIYKLDCFGLTIQDKGRMQISYCLSHYRGGTEEVESQNLSLPDIPDAEGLDRAVVAFDIVDDQECVLFVQLRQEERIVKYMAVHLSMAGSLQRMTDLYPAMAENGIFDREGYVFDKIHVDADGNYYLIADDRQDEVLVLRKDGTYLDQIMMETGGYSVQFSMKDPAGNPVFEWYDPWEDMLWLTGYFPPSGTKIYAHVKIPPNMPKAMSADGFLYYMNMNKLYRWELETGKVAYCMDCGEIGLRVNPMLVSMALSDDGNPILLSQEGEKACIYLTDTEQDAAQTLVRLISMTPYCDYVSRCAADFSRQGESVALIVEKPQTEGLIAEEITRVEQEFREHALLEFTAGKAADLYLVSAADMEMLYEKGALADMTGVLPSELESCIFRGVLESGVIDDRQVGLPPEATVTIAMVSNELWERDGWTYEETMNLLDSHSDLEYLLVNPGYNYGTGYLNHIFLRDLGKSPFLNLEEGICDFTDPLFVRILKHIQGYQGYGRWEDDPLENGKAAGFFATLVSYPYFTQLMSEYGDRYHPVGFPTEEGSGNYWNCNYFLVMNKDTPYQEEVKEFLISLFELERQRNSEHPIRNDLISQYTVYNNGEWLYDYGNGVYSILYTKADGSSWEQEYLALLNGSVYCPDDTEDIVDIVQEEAEEFFSGVRDAEKTAEIIQNRVQLYLSEQSN